MQKAYAGADHDQAAHAFCFLLRLFVVNLTVQHLKRFYFTVSMSFHILDTACSSPGGGNCGHIRNLGLYGGLAQIAVIMDAVLAYG